MIRLGEQNILGGIEFLHLIKCNNLLLHNLLCDRFGELLTKQITLFFCSYVYKYIIYVFSPAKLLPRTFEVHENSCVTLTVCALYHSRKFLGKKSILENQKIEKFRTRKSSGSCQVQATHFIKIMGKLRPKRSGSCGKCECCCGHLYLPLKFLHRYSFTVLAAPDLLYLQPNPMVSIFLRLICYKARSWSLSPQLHFTLKILVFPFKASPFLNCKL